VVLVTSSGAMIFFFFEGRDYRLGEGNEMHKEKVIIIIIKCIKYIFFFETDTKGSFGSTFLKK
jgi:hypothetical protein